MNNMANYEKDEKIYLEDNTCPNREERAGFAIKAYHGQATELLEDAKSGILEHQERQFEQSGGCMLNFYMTMRLGTIRDGVMIIHSPVGCTSLSMGYRETYRNVPQELGRPPVDFHWLTTNLSENDVVFGGAEKLKAAVYEAQRRYNPKSIFILTSCVSGVIGDDVEAVVNETQPNISAKIVPIHCEGHRSRVIQTTYDSLWHGVLKYLVREPEKKQEDLVNLASMFSYTWQDRLYIEKLLGKLGLRVNFIPEFATTEQFEQLGEAAVTAPLCSTFSEYLARGLKQEYDVPYFTYPSPMGFANTDEWLRKIAEHTGKEKIVEDVIEEERKLWGPELEVLKEKLAKVKGNGEKPTVIGAIGQGRVLTQNPFFKELGLDIPGTYCLDFDGFGVDDLETLINKIGDFEILVNTFQPAEQVNLCKSIDPDFYLTCPLKGGSYKRHKSVTRIHSTRGDPTPESQQVGYAGAVTFANLLYKSYINRAFNNMMLEKTGDLYKKWWYEQPDPLYYLKGEETSK